MLNNVSEDPRRHGPRLHAVVNDTGTYDHVFCGPAAISSITGRKASRVIAEFKKLRGHNGKIGSTGPGECAEVIRRLGYPVAQHLGYHALRHRFGGKVPSLALFLRKRTPEERAMTFMVMLSHHWVAVRGNKFCDSFQREPVNIGKAHCRRAWVKGVLRVWKKPRARPAVKLAA